MIDDNDLEAVERYIKDWHRQRRVVRDDGTPVFDERTENEFVEDHLDRVHWVRMWARKAGILANEKDAKETRQ